MLLKKKDYESLLKRLDKLESETECQKNMLVTYNKWINNIVDGLKQVEKQCYTNSIACKNLEKDWSNLRDVIFSFFTGVNDVCKKHFIYSEKEIDRMSADDFKSKILVPMIKREEKAV
jgi:hypothetical protein